jgi:HTH-type transcriptional regulator/antitoxin HigA
VSLSVSKAIKFKEDYNLALTRLETIFHAETDTPDGDEAEVLFTLI